MSRPLGIHWSSNAAWCNSGYGVQTKLFLQRLRALGHNMSATFWYGLEGGVLNMDGIPVYPKGGHSYGADVTPVNAKTAGAEIAITLIDAWVLDPDAYPPDVRFCPWFPVDMEPIPPPVARVVSRAFRPIVYSEFARKMCNDAGIDVAYVPHGVDCQNYKPLDRAQCRAEMGWRSDMFIVGMVAANKGYPSRKAFPECLEGFKLFADKHKDAVLYLHTTMGENGQFGGVNLPEIINALGLKDRVLFVDQFQNHLGIQPEKMAKLFNAFDVLLSPSAGEGFGVPILEAQACGCPVITGDWTAMPELTFCGWKIDKEDSKPHYTLQASYQWWPLPSAIAYALEEAYDWRRPAKKVADMVEAARQYDADAVTQNYWAPVLSDIANRIDAANSLQQSLMGAVHVPGMQIPVFQQPSIGGAAVAEPVSRPPDEPPGNAVLAEPLPETPPPAQAAEPLPEPEDELIKIGGTE